MEIALLGFLGAVGYFSNQRKNMNNNADKITATQLENEFRNDVAQHLNNPNVVVGGQTDITNNVPFFRSMKSQNTNSMVKDRRLETFTGVNNVDYMPKREREADAPIKGLTNIYGTTFAPDMERYHGYVTNGVQNNVTPFEKQYVGPGLGVSVDTPSAGGFHQRFRILPDNVNGYRKNTFGGEIVVGKSHIDKGTSVSHDTRDLGKKLTASEMYAIGDRPLDAAYGHIHGPSVYSNGQASLSDQNNRGTSMDVGLLGAVGAMSSTGSHVVQQSTRDSENLYATCVMGGQHRSVNGGYQNARYLVANESDREDVNCHRLNVGGNSFGSIVTAKASSGETQRGEANTQQLGKQQPGLGFTARGYNANPTQKDFDATYRMGIAGSSISQGSQVGVQNMERTNTLRGQAFNKDGSAGPAGSYVSAAQRYDRMFTDHEKAAVYDHTPNTQRTVNMMYGSNELRNTLTQQKSDWNENRVMSNGQGVGTSNFTNRTQLGYVYASQDSNVNTRDFGYAPENELRTNILVQPTHNV